MPASYFKYKEKVFEALALGLMYWSTPPLMPTATVYVQQKLNFYVTVISLLPLIHQSFGEMAVLSFSIFMEKLNWKFGIFLKNTIM
jgi:hypothetical protein